VIRISAIPRSRCSRAEQVQHLRLHGDVERRRRLVGDQELRIAGDRHRDHHPLRHAAGQLVRKRGESRRRVGNLDLPQAARGPRARRAAPLARSTSVPWTRSASSIWNATV
jgi:hypothetical protein